MTRRSLTSVQRTKIFLAAAGVCHFCEVRIHAERGEAWDVSHVIPLEAGGKDEPENMLPAHRTCHRKHTAEVDAPLIAKTKRQRGKNLGIRKPSTFQTSRDGKWKAKIGGGAERRQSP